VHNLTRNKLVTTLTDMKHFLFSLGITVSVSNMAC